MTPLDQKIREAAKLEAAAQLHEVMSQAVHPLKRFFAQMGLSGDEALAVWEWMEPHLYKAATGQVSLAPWKPINEQLGYPPLPEPIVERWQEKITKVVIQAGREALARDEGRIEEDH